ncbi:MAG: queuosine salvage family protein, partial [Solirubrobacteraceae bacterium]
MGKRGRHIDDLTDRVRRACAEVAARAGHVTIDRERTIAVAHQLPEAASVPAPDPGIHYLDGPREAVTAFVLCLDTINFGSGWWPTVRKRAGHSGYMTMAGRLADHFRAHGPWTAQELNRLDAAAVADVLGQDRDHELMGLFAAALRDLGAHVCDHADGDFAGLVNQAGRSA